MISVLIPVFNERQSVATLYHELVDVLQKTGHQFEIIFIDDGSTDDSISELKS